MARKSIQRQRPVLEEIEPRILYSADLAALSGYALGGVTEQRLIDHAAPATPPSAFTAQTAQAQAANREIVFVDTGVDGWDSLVDAIDDQSGTRTLEVVLLDTGSDGIRQISDTLAQYRDIAAVHIVSHGQDGVVQLGSSRLDANSLTARHDEIEGWGRALSGDADLLLYGCDVAQHVDGKALVDALARTTGADVAASDDATGAAARGGDWMLEVASGHIETGSAVGAGATDWGGLLALTPLGGEARVNTVTTGNQTTSFLTGGNVAMDANGNYVVAWDDTRSGNSDVWARLYNADGSARTNEFIAHLANSSAQNSASVAMAANGKFLVTWNDNRSGTDEVYMRLFDSAGTALTSEQQVSDLTGVQSHHAADFAADGSFVIAFANASNQDIYFRRYDATGVAQGGSAKANTKYAILLGFPDLAVADNGSFVIVWHNVDEDGDGFAVNGRRFDALGNALDAVDFRINTNTVGDQSYASVAAAGDGSFVVTWRSEFQDSGDAGIYGQRYDSLGAKQGSEFRINTYTNSEQTYSHVDMNSDGAFIVTWQSAYQDGSLSGIYAQQFDRLGARVGGEILVNTTTTNDQTKPSVAYVGTKAVVVWSGNGTQTGNIDDVGVFMQRYAVSGANVAPVLNNTKNPALTSINEDAGAPVGAVGTLVSSLVDFAAPAGQVDNVTDPDTGAQLGIAVITAANTSNGSWWYSTTNGTNWSALGGVSNTSARLLAADANTRLYFQPNANYTGTTGAITFRAWDQTSGSNGGTADTTSNGGSTAFSSATDTAILTVVSINDAPVLDNSGSMTLGTITEDETTNSGNTVAQIIASAGGDRITDPDAGAVEGIAVTGLSSGNGTWQYSINGGTNWFSAGTVSDGAALLLRATDKLRFVPDARNADAASVTFRAWDQTSGSAGSMANASVNGGSTAFSTAIGTVSITVTSVNDAPSMPSVALTSTSEDVNATVSVSFFAGFSSDVDIGALKGLAIVGVDDTNGTWQYTLNGTNWFNIDSVSANHGLLLAADATSAFRFVPNANWNGRTGMLQYKAWDQTSGTAGTYVDASVSGGTTAFSGTNGSTLVVSAVNDAPVASGNAILAAINEDTAAPPGATVSALFSGNFSDAVDQVAGGSSANTFAGIAVSSYTIDASKGNWQYSANGGSSWTTLSNASTTAALTLNATDLLRFVPAANVNGAATGLAANLIESGLAITSGATINLTAATGGSTHISAATVALSQTITAVNDAPTLGNGALAAVLEDTASPAGQAVSAIFSGQFSDPDAGSSLSGIAVVDNTANVGTQGTWQYSTNAGSNWYAIGTVADGATALALNSSTLIRFLPVADYNGAPPALVVRGLDNTYAGGFATTAGSETRVYINTTSNGGSTAIAAVTANLATSISAVNDAPSFAAGTGQASTGFAVGSLDFVNAVAIQADGKIVAVGYTQNSNNKDFAVARYNTDGTLDTSFGGGTGKVSTAIGGSDDLAEGVVLLADGRILVAGTTYTGVSFDMVLVRYNADGTLDTSFGGGTGIAKSGLSGSDEGHGLVVQSDGKILVAGTYNYNFGLARFNSNGSLDTSFGSSGFAVTDFAGENDGAYSIALQADGRIVLGGFAFNGTSFDFAVARYNTDGSLDTTFNGTGKVMTDLGTASSDTGHQLTLQPDGRILLAGWSDAGGTNDFALVRYNVNGSLDTSFGAGTGKVTTAIGTGSDLGESVTVQADGKILVAGHNTAGNNFAVVRYNDDGSLDTTFNGTGKVDTNFGGSSDDRGLSVLVQADGKIVVAGTSTVGGDYDFAVVRYNANGTIDSRFNTHDSLGGTVVYTEKAAPVVLDNNVVVFDAELSTLNNFSGATLTLIRNGGADAQDVYSATGFLGAMTQGGNLVYNGTIMGTVTTNSGGTLLLKFNASATQTLVNSALRSIAYSNSSAAPPASVLINWTFNDGNAGAQGSGGALTASGSTTVNITPINDAPVNLMPANRYTALDTATVFSGVNALQISDADASSGMMRVTLSATQGTLTLLGTTGLMLAGGVNGSASFSYTGTLSDLNAALNVGLAFTPTNGFRGLAQITLLTSDQGNTGSGGAQSDTDMLNVHVGAIVVTNATDLKNGDVTSIDKLVASDGGDGISLHEAILAVNATGGTDYITFSIAGAGAHTIAPCVRLVVASKI